VRDEDWLDAMPTGRPAMIVADGLMGFLSRHEFVSLLNRLVSHFPSGEMVSTATPRSPSGWPTTLLAPRPSPTSSSSPADPREPEGWNPKLKPVEEILLSKDLAQVPSKLRWYYRLQQHSRSWSRKGTIILHFSF
jgi:O-methyltransferase involved in polyketide biosynthesis